MNRTDQSDWEGAFLHGEAINPPSTDQGSACAEEKSAVATELAEQPIKFFSLSCQSRGAWLWKCRCKSSIKATLWLVLGQIQLKWGKFTMPHNLCLWKHASWSQSKPWCILMLLEVQKTLLLFQLFTCQNYWEHSFELVTLKAWVKLIFVKYFL